ncbi:MAG TPA: alpha/beta fold hydrolase [Candidatus Polarisedimenticolaceae bacterium]|nr:alpha/beta fold hydrolase [Candidatus Polarisedimenticolaceae bacterium]
MSAAEVRRLWIPGPAGRLEAALRVAACPRATAVVAHPHPLHGGTLHNPVVFHAERRLNRAGLTTLRFNFRGVGESQGLHDAGRGEVDDLSAAASWVRGLADEVPLVVVGYSFGAACALRLARVDRSVRAVVCIGLPLGGGVTNEVDVLTRPVAVVQAERDEFGEPDAVRRWLARADSAGRLYVVERTTHLFPGRAREAADRVGLAVEHLLRRIDAG